MSSHHARDGSFYGAGTSAHTLGTFYRVSSDGAFKMVKAWSDSLGRPSGGILEGDDGNFYLPMFAGLVSITPNGDVTELAQIPDQPIGGLTYDAQHEYIYGITEGMRVYRFKIGGQVETVAQLAPAACSLGDLALGPDGVHFYTACNETIYSISPDGQVQVVATAPGRVIYSQRLVFDSDGVMYGTTWEGGTRALGMFFEVTGY